MADIPMIIPQLYAKRNQTRPELLGGPFGYSNSTNAINKHAFVTLTAGVLVAVASAGVLSCGLIPDAAAASTSTVPNPPTNFFGDKHYVYSAGGGQRFAVSMTDATGHVGAANGAPQLSEAVVGTAYGIIKLSNGNHALNIDNTTQLFFIVVEKPATFNGTPQDANAYNPVLIVELVPAVIQSL